MSSPKDVSVTVAGLIDDLVTRARAETGLHDFGGDSWREGLEVIVRSAESEARLTPAGRDGFYASLVRPLVNRLQIEDWYARHPEIDEQEVEIELLGVGFPRTGSTALSHLLAEDPALRSLRVWEETAPCPPPGVSEEADRARLEGTRAGLALTDQVAARLRSMLPQSANGPMEDHDLMALEFKAQFYLTSARLPSYADWFVDCDQEPTYRYEKRVFKLLQWRCPPTRWRLKSPTHTLFLDAYNKVFPEARFVMTHRDVSKVLPSVADLYYTMLQGGNVDVDPHEIGQLNIDQWGTALDRVLAFRAAGHDDRFYDIGFSAFQADPIAQIRGLYAWLGEELTTETEAAMRAWRDDNPRDKYGTHEYDASDFGITEDKLAARFGAYRERFAPYLD